VQILYIVGRREVERSKGIAEDVPSRDKRSKSDSCNIFYVYTVAIGVYTVTAR
jgi:hypothetical protein